MMGPVWEVAVYHFKREVFKKSYILTLLSLPLFLVFTIGLGQLATSALNNDIRIGVVDPGGFLQVLSIEGRQETAEIIIFNSKIEAEARLRAETDPLRVIYVLPANYPGNREVDMIYEDYPPSEAREYFSDILKTNLLAGQQEALRNRAIEGPLLTIKAISVNREFPVNNPSAELLIPLMLAVIYIFTIFPIAGIMVGALGDEKTNRTIEVVITSISPRTMISGKILAVSAIALLQVTIWIFFFVGAAWISGNWFDIVFFQDITVHWRDVVAIASLALPGFVFYGAALVMLGSLIDDSETLQQASGLVLIPLFLPIYVLPVILDQPDGLLAMVFSFLPITSVQTVGIQSLFMEVPSWRIATATGVSWLISLGMTWFAVRAFRVGMLRYGKRIRIGELFNRKQFAR